MPDRQCRGEKTSEGTNHCTRRDKVNTRAFKSLIKQGDGLIDASQTNKHKYRQTNETIASPSSGGADSDSQSKSFLSDWNESEGEKKEREEGGKKEEKKETSTQRREGEKYPLLKHEERKEEGSVFIVLKPKGRSRITVVAEYEMLRDMGPKHENCAKGAIAKSLRLSEKQID